jgi:hypothetical protein
MTTDDPFDGLLAAWLRAVAVPTAPPGLLDRAVDATRAIRPAAHPAWLGRAGVLVATAVLVVGAISIAVTGTVRTTTPDRTLPPRAIVAGEPIPDALLGSWTDIHGDTTTFRRAGDAACVEVVRTIQDCASFDGPDGTPQLGTGQVLTIDGGALVLWETVGPCRAQPTAFDYRLDGDRLVLTRRPGGCTSGQDVVVLRRLVR